MTDYVLLQLTRNRGLPWPEDSFGRTPLFGENGWCRTCGTPFAEQSGMLVLQARELGCVAGAWVPNWLFDVVCLEEGLAARLERQFGVETREILTPRGKRVPARQLVIPATPEPWYQPDALVNVLEARHGLAGERCDQCTTWRWRPLDESLLPPPRISERCGSIHAIASPERFGVGLRSFRQLLFSRPLALAILASGRTDFVLLELPPDEA
ncbi:MAG: hypothetical protein ACO25F_09205 [Erythrobacter sp.]